MKTKRVREETLNRGAADDRAAIKAHMEMMPIKATIPDKNGDLYDDLISRDDLRDFIDGMASRADHRKGGRGRKFVAEPVKKGAKRAPKGQGRG